MFNICYKVMYKITFVLTLIKNSSIRLLYLFCNFSSIINTKGNYIAKCETNEMISLTIVTFPTIENNIAK